MSFLKRKAAAALTFAFALGLLPAAGNHTLADETVSEKVEEAGQDTKKGVKKIGRKAKKAGRNARSGGSDAGEDAKDGLKNAGDEIGDKADDVKKKVD